MVGGTGAGGGCGNPLYIFEFFLYNLKYKIISSLFKSYMILEDSNHTHTHQHRSYSDRGEIILKEGETKNDDDDEEIFYL